MNKAPDQIMLELHKKFGANFDDWNSLTGKGFDKAFTGLQCIAAVGEVLHQRDNSKHHKICCKIYDEIFSDGISAIYLATNAMDKPANIVLRRALELGVAAIYLWDMPHMAHSWNDFGQDLSFSAMLSHVNSKGYLAYVSNENSKTIDTGLFPTAKSQEIYGTLSDFVHGKITTFESSMPERFKFVEEEWQEFVVLIEDVISILVKAFLTRFDISDEVFTKVPLARKEFN